MGQTTAAGPEAGLRQIAQNQSFEFLAVPGEDGRMRPQIAERWSSTTDGLTLDIHLRPNVLYHDGTPVVAEDVVSILQRTLPRFMGPAFGDISSISVTGPDGIRIKSLRRSTFVLEALEAQIQKPGHPELGTGPYVIDPDRQNELRAYDKYYLGKPTVPRIVVSSYPTVRAAWAELLRNNIDMLYEVGVEARDSLQNARNVATVFPYTRRYQYVVVLNNKRGALSSADVRRALNVSIERNALVASALDGHGVPSSGPIWPKFWAVPADLPKLTFDRKTANSLIARVGHHVRFTCLVPPDYERLGLVLKQQWESIGVTVDLKNATPDQVVRAAESGEYDAFLADVNSGPTIFRLYRFWHSGGPTNVGGFGNRSFDRSLDDLQYAGSEADYRAALVRLQAAFLEDPPAIFIAWSEGARAISRRFELPADSDHRDVLSTLRLWHPANVQTAASRN